MIKDILVSLESQAQEDAARAIRGQFIGRQQKLSQAKPSQIKKLATSMNELHYRYALEYVVSQSGFKGFIEHFVTPDFNETLKKPRVLSYMVDGDKKLSEALLTTMFVYNREMLKNLPESFRVDALRDDLLNIEFLTSCHNELRTQAIEAVMSSELVDCHHFSQLLIKSGNPHSSTIIEKFKLEDALALAPKKEMYKL